MDIEAEEGKRNKLTILIFSLSYAEKTFQIRPLESDTLTFSSSLPQFSSLKSFWHHNLELTLRPGSYGTSQSLHIFHLSPFSYPLIPKIKGEKKPPLPIRPPLVQIWSNHSWVWHWTLFQGFSSHLSYSLLLLFFPFLILPRSEDYAKQGMRVKGKFSG